MSSKSRLCSRKSHSLVGFIDGMGEGFGVLHVGGVRP
jgi:hypothetical protein